MPLTDALYDIPDSNYYYLMLTIRVSSTKETILLYTTCTLLGFRMALRASLNRSIRSLTLRLSYINAVLTEPMVH
jgi:hypothetical protein